MASEKVSVNTPAIENIVSSALLIERREEVSSNWNGRGVVQLEGQQSPQDANSIAVLCQQVVTRQVDGDSRLQAERVSIPRLPYLDSLEPFDIDKEVEVIRSYPAVIQELIGSYICPVDAIVEIVQRDEEIPDYLMRHMRHVVHLDLSFQKLTESQILKLLNCCRSLEILKMPQNFFTHEQEIAIFFGHANPLVDNPVVLEIVKRIATFENLEHLDMTKWTASGHGSSFITEEMIVQLVSNGKLKYLNLMGCFLLTDKGVSVIVETCGDLKYLNLSRCGSITDESLSLISKLSNLVVLEIDDNYTLTDTGISHLESLTSLESLSLGGLGRISDASVDVIVKCQSLKSLDLSACGTLTDVGFKKLAILEKLESLNLSYCKNFTNGVLEKLSNLENLKELALEVFDNSFNFVDDEGLRHLRNCTKLQYLNLSGWAQITKEGTYHLSKLTELERLNVVGCKYINNGALKNLYSLKKLKILKAYHTKVSFIGVYCIKKQIPQLEIHT